MGDGPLLAAAPDADRKERSAAGSGGRVALGFYIGGTIATTVVSAVARKAMYDAWGQKYELTNLLYNLWASFIIIGCACRYPSFRDSIKRSAAAFHPVKLLIPAAMDGLADFLSSVGGPSTPGSWSVLLGQLSVFFTMVLSALFLRSRYSRLQVAGAVLVVVGASLAIIPDLLNGAVSRSAVIYVALFFLSDLPQSGGQVYKDYAFKAGDLNVFYLTAVVSWFQLAMTWLYLPLLSIPQLGGFDLRSIPEVFHDGARCFIGDSSIPVEDHDGNVTGHCDMHVFYVTMVFSVSGFVSGILALMVMKRGSATLSVLTTACTLPLSDLAFSWPALMRLVSVEPTEFSWYNLGGLALVVVGFVGYGLKLSKSDADAEQASGQGGELEYAALSSSRDDEAGSGLDAI